MRVHVAWPLSFAFIAVILLSIIVYQRSWVPDYQEAEPLIPIVSEFGRALADANAGNPVSDSSVKKLLMEKRFEAIRSYGVVYSDDQETLVSIRVNDHFLFKVAFDGACQLIKQ